MRVQTPGAGQTAQIQSPTLNVDSFEATSTAAFESKQRQQSAKRGDSSVAPDFGGGEQRRASRKRLGASQKPHATPLRSTALASTKSFQLLAAELRHKPLESQPRIRILSAPPQPALEADDDESAGASSPGSSRRHDGTTDSYSDSGTAPIARTPSERAETVAFDYSGSDCPSRPVKSPIQATPLAAPASSAEATTLCPENQHPSESRGGLRSREAAASRLHIFGHRDAPPAPDIAGCAALETPRNMHNVARSQGSASVAPTYVSSHASHAGGFGGRRPGRRQPRPPSSADLKFIPADSRATALFVPYLDGLRDLGLELSAAQHDSLARAVCPVDAAALRHERVSRLHAVEAAQRAFADRELKIAEELADDRRRVR